MKKTSKAKEHKYRFKEFGPIYFQRDNEEITCEPSGVGIYTLTDFGCSDSPSVAFFHSVEVSDFNAIDEEGKKCKLTAEEKEQICEQIIEALDENQDFDL